MKKIVTVVLAVVLLFVSLQVYAQYPIEDRVDISVFVNGKHIYYDSNGVAIMIKTATLPEGLVNLAPVRAVSEALGANINWEGSTKTVTIYNDKAALALQVDNSTISVGERMPDGNYGNIVSSQVTIAPINVNGTVYIPIRLVSETLGANVYWNREEKRVEIIKSEE